MMIQHLRDQCTASDRVLDLGSKDGENMDSIEAETIAIDLKYRSTNSDTEYILGDGTRMPFESETFDYILCNQVFEHVPNLENLVKEMSRVLKTGGKALITFPNRLAPIKPHSTPWWSSYLPQPIGEKILPYVVEPEVAEYYKNEEFMLTPLKARYYLHQEFATINYVCFKQLSYYKEKRLARLDDLDQSGLVRKLVYGIAPYAAKVENKPVLGWGLEMTYAGVSYIAVK